MNSNPSSAREVGQPAELPAPMRHSEQRKAIMSNLATGLNGYIVAGSIMMLYANDVLHFSPKSIATIAAFAPLAAAIRFFFLHQIRRLGFMRAMMGAGWVKMLAALLLIAIPAQHLSFPALLLLIIIFLGAHQLGMGTVWQPYLRNITTIDDRASFFARMRLSWTCVSAVATAVISAVIGARITEFEYKILLVVAILGVANQLFWVSQFTEGFSMEDAGSESRREPFTRVLWRTIRRSELLRRPLLVALLVWACDMPIMVVYLRQMMHIPSNILSVYILAGTLGAAVSFLFWGRVSDAIGFQPVLIGLLAISIVSAPFILLVTPMAPDMAGWHAMGARDALSLGTLLLTAFAGGALGAGTGIATTSIMHYYVRDEDALEAMNLFSLAQFAVQAVVAYFSGWLLQDIALPSGSHALLGGILHADWIKACLVVGIPALQGVAIWHLSKMPNIRPDFGVGDFFYAVFPEPVRTLYDQSRVGKHRRRAKKKKAALRSGEGAD